MCSSDLAESIGKINPFRYRSYYFDEESGLYYLQSRFYDANIGRFINADVVEMMVFQVDNVITTNLFAYCNNNPMIYEDSRGYGFFLFQYIKIEEF